MYENRFYPVKPAMNFKLFFLGPLTSSICLFIFVIFIFAFTDRLDIWLCELCRSLWWRHVWIWRQMSSRQMLLSWRLSFDRWWSDLRKRRSNLPERVCNAQSRLRTENFAQSPSRRKLHGNVWLRRLQQSWKNLDELCVCVCVRVKITGLF